MSEDHLRETKVVGHVCDKASGAWRDREEQRISDRQDFSLIQSYLVLP